MTQSRNQNVDFADFRTFMYSTWTFSGSVDTGVELESGRQPISYMAQSAGDFFVEPERRLQEDQANGTSTPDFDHFSRMVVLSRTRNTTNHLFEIWAGRQSNTSTYEVLPKTRNAAGDGPGLTLGTTAVVGSEVTVIDDPFPREMLTTVVGAPTIDDDFAFEFKLTPISTDATATWSIQVLLFAGPVHSTSWPRRGAIFSNRAIYGGFLG